MVNGYDFADVIAAYYRGFEEGDETLKADAVRWLRGEFSTKTDARRALVCAALSKTLPSMISSSYLRALSGWQAFPASWYRSMSS